MKKIHLILSLTAGGIALLLLSVFIMLAMKGGLNNQTLSHVPILGRLFGPPAPIVIVKASEKETTEKKETPPEKVLVPDVPPIAHFTLPSPFNAKELNELSIQLEETKKNYEEKFEEQNKREESLNQREKDVEARWTELNKFASKIEDLRKQIEEQMKALQKSRAEIESTEMENVATVAQLYENMTDDTKIAAQLDKLGVDRASRIIEKISSSNAEKASSILAAMDPEKATEVMNLTLRRKKSTP